MEGGPGVHSSLHSNFKTSLSCVSKQTKDRKKKKKKIKCSGPLYMYLLIRVSSNRMHTRLNLKGDLKYFVIKCELKVEGE